MLHRDKIPKSTQYKCEESGKPERIDWFTEAQPFLRSYWYGSKPALFPILLSVSRTSDTQEDREWETICWQERGGGDGGRSWKERRHGSTRVPGHAFTAWPSAWRMVVYIYYTYNSSWKFNHLAAGGSFCQGNRCGTEKAGDGLSITYKITPTRSLSSSQPGEPPCWTSPLAFGLIGRGAES